MDPHIPADYEDYNEAQRQLFIQSQRWARYGWLWKVPLLLALLFALIAFGPSLRENIQLQQPTVTIVPSGVTQWPVGSAGCRLPAQGEKLIITIIPREAGAIEQSCVVKTIDGGWPKIHPKA
jgi:hypothetical protein